MSCNFKNVIMKDGEVYNTVEDTRIYRRVTADYSADIIGMWEGHSTGEDGTERIYDLSGRPLKSQPSKGVYIKNGKKYVNK